MLDLLLALVGLAIMLGLNALVAAVVLRLFCLFLPNVQASYLLCFWISFASLSFLFLWYLLLTFPLILNITHQRASLYSKVGVAVTFFAETALLRFQLRTRQGDRVSLVWLSLVSCAHVAAWWPVFHLLFLARK